MFYERVAIFKRLRVSLRLRSSRLTCCFLRGESGAGRVVRVRCGGRAGAWRVAVPWDLLDGAAASCLRLPGPGGSQPRVSQPAGCSACQLPQCCFALRPGQAEYFFLSVLIVTLNYLSLKKKNSSCCSDSSQAGVKTILSGFHSILSQKDPSLTGLLSYLSQHDFMGGITWKTHSWFVSSLLELLVFPAWPPEFKCNV